MRHGGVDFTTIVSMLMVAGDFNAPFHTFDGNGGWQNLVQYQGRTEFDENMDLYNEPVDLIVCRNLSDSFKSLDESVIELKGSTWEEKLLHCMENYGSDHVPVLVQSTSIPLDFICFPPHLSSQFLGNKLGQALEIVESVFEG